MSCRTVSSKGSSQGKSPAAIRLRISLPVHGTVSSRRSAMMRGAIEDGVSWHMMTEEKNPSPFDAAGPRSRRSFTHLWVRFQERCTEDERPEGAAGWKLH